VNLLKRVIIAMIFIPLLLFVFYKSGWYLTISLGLIVFLQNFELRNMEKQKSIDIPFISNILSVFVFLAFAHSGFEIIVMSLLLVFFLVAGKDIFTNRLKDSFKRISATMFNVLYTAVFLSTIVLISKFEQGNKLNITLLGLIWITDTFAYFVGKTLGKHRGIFKASPMKSLEGFLGGIFFAVLASYFIYYFKFIPLKEAIFAGISAGFFGQIGDLFESVLKRDFGVKDSSSIIPGHGGLLDRFDSLMFAAPVFYVFLSIF